MKGIALALRDGALIGAAQPYCRLKERIEYCPQIEGRAADCFEHFRGGSLLLPRLAQFAGKQTILGRRRLVFRHIAALRLWRLVTPASIRFSACSGAPFHRVPRRLRGIVAGRRGTLEVAFARSSNKAL